MSQAESPMRTKAALKRADPDVGSQHERQPSSRRRAVHRGDDRLGDGPQVGDEAGDVLLGGEQLLDLAPSFVARDGAVAAQVDAGAERPPRAGQQHHPALVFGRDRIEGGVEVGHHLDGHGVEGRRPVQGDAPETDGRRIHQDRRRRRPRRPVHGASR